MNEYTITYMEHENHLRESVKADKFDYYGGGDVVF